MKVNAIKLIFPDIFQEKLLWSFEFFDVNKDGIISRDEMLKVRKRQV